LCLYLSSDEVQARLAAGEEATVRFKVPAGEISFTDLIHGTITFSSEVIGDFIIRRTDGGFAYNYAVVIDDAGMKITHVVRGQDHITNTARQLMLFKALGEPAPDYAHHSLIHGTDGGKLSKRHGATSIGDFRDMGYLAPAVVNYLALLSWHPADEREKFTLDELVDEFDMARVSKSPAVFDLDKLNWLNGLYLRELTVEELSPLVQPYLDEAGVLLHPGQREVVVAAIQSNLVTLADAPEYAGLFVEDFDLAGSESRDLIGREAGPVLDLLEQVLNEREQEYFGLEEGHEILARVGERAKELGLKGKQVYQPLRVVLTGRNKGPELFYLLAGLGRSRILQRVAAARNYLAAVREA
jgi:nondiscriminating glutamyl-tRNA synthetase